MSQEWRDQALQRHARELEAWLESEATTDAPRTDDQFESEARTNFLAAARHYDPQAQLEEQMHVRLLGERAQGGLDFELGRRLFKPLEEGLDAGADGEVHLELADVVSGSTVLVVRPRRDPAAASEEVLAPADTSAADQGARQWLLLVQAAEQQRDLRPWSAAFDALGQLVKVLDDYGLNVGFAWLAASGQVRRAELTERGRGYVHTMSSGTAEALEKPLGGYVTELRASGHVVVKSGRSKRAPSYDIRFDDTDELIALRLQLGQYVWFIVREETTTDRFQRLLKTTYTFVRMAANQPPLA